MHYIRFETDNRTFVVPMDNLILRRAGENHYIRVEDNYYVVSKETWENILEVLESRTIHIPAER